MASDSRLRERVFVTPISPEYKLTGEVWGIFMAQVHNWWLFDWLGAWMMFRIKAVKGKSTFTGRLTKVLVESDKLHRNHLTLFNFQSKSALIGFILNKVRSIQLQLIQKSFTNPTAGLCAKVVANLGLNENAKGKVRLVYMVHVFECDELLDLCGVQERLVQHDIFVHFAGLKNGLVGYGKKTMPFEINGVLILAAFEQSQFTELLKTNWYQELLSFNHENFVGIYLREYQ